MTDSRFGVLELTDYTKTILQKLVSSYYPPLKKRANFTPEQMIKAGMEANDMLERLAGQFHGTASSPPKGFDTSEQAADAVVSVVNGIKKQNLSSDPVASVVSSKYNACKNNREVYAEEWKEVINDLIQAANNRGLDIESRIQPGRQR